MNKLFSRPVSASSIMAPIFYSTLRFFQPLACFILVSISINGFGQHEWEYGFMPGKVIDTVKCIDNKDQSYAIYLPSSYNSTRKWPVVFVFEPLARGKLPVTLFKPGAEKFGYIIISSNNSRNGSWDRIFSSAEAMMADASKRFSIDQSRIYTAGFSGGGRAACALAVFTGNVKGVISCGAGFPSNTAYLPSKGMTWHYIGIVGVKDMNFQEHISVKARLDKLGISNQLMLFNGPHTWPDSAYLQSTLHWMSYMNEKSVGKITHSIDYENAFVLEKNSIDKLVAETQLTEKVRRLHQLAELIGEETFKSDIRKELEVIRSSKAFIKLNKKEQKIAVQEKDLRDTYVHALAELHYGKFSNQTGLKGKDWWKLEIKYLNKLTASPDSMKRDMGLRIKNMIWASCAETSFGLMEQKEFDDARVFCELWLMIQPESTWGLMTMSKLFAYQNEVSKSIKYLDRAINSGLNNKTIILSDPAFRVLMNESEFISLLDSLNN